MVNQKHESKSIGTVARDESRPCGTGKPPAPRVRRPRVEQDGRSHRRHPSLLLRRATIQARCIPSTKRLSSLMPTTRILKDYARAVRPAPRQHRSLLGLLGEKTRQLGHLARIHFFQFLPRSRRQSDRTATTIDRGPHTSTPRLPCPLPLRFTPGFVAAADASPVGPLDLLETVCEAANAIAACASRWSSSAEKLRVTP